jgi:hypothetical protein
LGARVEKAPIMELGFDFDRNSESTKKAFTAEKGKKGSCIKKEIYHKKSELKFHIGFLKKDGKDKPELFVSISLVRICW